MAGNNFQITGDNLPRDSGNRYYWALYDPVNNNFALPWGYPVSGSAAGMVAGHAYQQITDTMTATGANSSGVDLGGYSVKGLIIPTMGSGCWLTFRVSASGVQASTLSNSAIGIYSATGSVLYALDATFLSILGPYRWIALSATQPQTATRTFTWILST